MSNQEYTYPICKVYFTQNTTTSPYSDTETAKDYLSSILIRQTELYFHDWYEGDQIKIFLSHQIRIKTKPHFAAIRVFAQIGIFYLLCPIDEKDSLQEFIPQIKEQLFNSDFQLEKVVFPEKPIRKRIREDQLHADDPFNIPSNQMRVKEFKIFF